MRVLCSDCHTTFEVEPEAEHKACPNCHAEAGLEPIKTDSPQPMKMFGAVLLLVALFVVGGGLIGLMS